MAVRATASAAAVWGLAAVASACAPGAIRLPGGASVPLPGAQAAAIAASATSACRGLTTVTAEISLSGKLGPVRFRGRVLAGFDRSTGSIRIEVPAPFGAPLLILAGRHDRATVVIPRGNYVLRDQPVAGLLEALTGLRRQTADLLALLTGCLAADPGIGPGESREFPSGWVSLPLAGGSTAFARRDGQAWRLMSGSTRPDADGAAGRPWLVAYSEFLAGMPAIVRLSRAPADTSGTDPGGYMTFRLSQVEANASIDPAAFSVAVPDGAAPLSLDELRQMGPLADRGGPARKH